MRTAERTVLVAIVVVIAATVRVAFSATADVRPLPTSDATEYARYAYNLVEHGVYSLSTDENPAPDSFRSPGFPMFLAACRMLAGDAGPSLAKWLQVVMSTLTVLLSYRIARQFVSFAPSVLAAVLVALSPHLVMASATPLTECLAGFVVVAGLWLLVGARSFQRELAGALVLGCAPLCNETMVYLPLVCAFAMWRCGRGRGRALSVLLVGLLPFAAWTVRNQCTELARTGGARAVASISHGSYPGMVYGSNPFSGFPYREDPEQPEFGSSWADLGRVLWPRVQADPLGYLKWYVLDKPVWLWRWPLVQGRDIYMYPVVDSPYERQAVMKASHALMRWLHLPVMLLAFAGVLYSVLRGRRESSWAVLALGWVSVLGTLAYVPVIPDPRYLQPIRPLLFVLSAAALPMIVGWWRARSGRTNGEREDAAVASLAGGDPA